MLNYDCLILVYIFDQAYAQMELTTLLGKDFKSRILHALKEQFKNFEKKKLLSAATILDPRFKKAFFSDIINAGIGVRYIGEF